jgi:hypothetical protein
MSDRKFLIRAGCLGGGAILLLLLARLIFGDEAVGKVALLAMLVIPLSLGFCVNVCGASFRLPKGDRN